jgi:hypothetical protein
MADPTIARPSTSVRSSEDPRDAATLLEETLTQLHSLLCYCHDHGHPAQEDAGPEHRNNVFWLASELARKAAELFQQCAPRAGT